MFVIWFVIEHVYDSGRQYEGHEEENHVIESHVIIIVTHIVLHIDATKKNLLYCACDSDENVVRL